MSDLISRAEAIKMITSLDENVVKHSSDMKILAVERIKRLPIAYDKEAVVEQLEELKAYRTLDKTNFSDGYNKAIDEILSIVKYYADKWDGIYHAIKRIEELKGEHK